MQEMGPNQRPKVATFWLKQQSASACIDFCAHRKFLHQDEMESVHPGLCMADGTYLLMLCVVGKLNPPFQASEVGVPLLHVWHRQPPIIGLAMLQNADCTQSDQATTLDSLCCFMGSLLCSGQTSRACNVLA